ncbi:MAG TPA: prepilin-type N-terminal cleavage/methylation domain-containing protein [Planctomycetaceae bacterium]|nr:prepilin-type N-terminal cleavage/methylation domain-containing protein [Planctomycetaceae bacterium]
MHRQRRLLTNPLHGRLSAGFTLLELLIAISIMLILLAITATAIRVNNEADRIRGGARTLQSYLLGAKDRAIYAKAPRGVRLLRDPNNPRAISSVVYVEPTPPENYTVDVIPFNTAAPYSSSNPMRRVRLPTTTNFNARDAGDWRLLVTRGMLTAGLRMKIPANDRGTWYVIQSVDVSGSNQDIVLTTEIRNPSTTGTLRDTAQIELPPAVVQNAEPVQLPRGVVIDLDRSGYRQPNPAAPPPVLFTPKFPSGWADSSGNYIQRMDIMFSPRGAVTGPSAGSGVIHLYVTDQAAADLGLDPAYGVNATGSVDPPIPDKALVSIFTRTGNVTVSPVNTTDARNNYTLAPGADNYADDPFYFSERGEVAGK